MNRGLALLALCLLVAGCDVSRRELVGSYVLVVDNTAQASLELKEDGTFVQTLRFQDQPEQTRTGKWHLAEKFEVGKPIERFGKDAYGPFVFLKNAAALEGCPKCKVVPANEVVYQVQAGMMNVVLVEDLKSGVGYAK